VVLTQQIGNKEGRVLERRPGTEELAGLVMDTCQWYFDSNPASCLSSTAPRD
jgi:hypothetical protein